VNARVPDEEWVSARVEKARHEREMALAAAKRLEDEVQRLAYRVVWVNPHKASPHFAPLAGGMAAALPYCDAFASGHNLTAMREVAAAIAARR